MNYFYSVLLWISPVTVDIPDARSMLAGLARFLAFVVFEEFHLAQALLRLFARLVRPAEIFALLFGNHFVAAFYSFDHALPSCANFPPPHNTVNTMPTVDLLASGSFLRYVLSRRGGGK